MSQELYSPEHRRIRLLKKHCVKFGFYFQQHIEEALSLTQRPPSDNLRSKLDAVDYRHLSLCPSMKLVVHPS